MIHQRPWWAVAGAWAVWMMAAGVLAGCSTVRPWHNQPLQPGAAERARAEQLAQAREARGIVAAVTLSGGGARAAAFGLGVLRELKATRFDWKGRPTTLLDQVGLVSGVSGGSILATHYAVFGDATLERFEPDFLRHNVDGELIRSALTPAALRDLSSPWYGRTQLLEQRLATLYGGRTFADLRHRSGAPELLVQATNLTTGAPFEFTPDQFRLICSDLDSVPLSLAVAASSAVPLLLSPVTLHNYAGRCPATDAIEAHQRAAEATRAASGDSQASYRARMLRLAEESLSHATERPYLHLVDGGVSDNLGVRPLIDRLVANGSIRGSFMDAPEGSIHQLVLIAVNAERDLGERIDQDDRVPRIGQVVDALLFGAASRETQMTLAMLEDDLQRWRRELDRLRGQPGSPFATDVSIEVVNVSLRDLPEGPMRDRALKVPTSFSIEPADVALLQEAGRQVLRQSPAYQRLVHGLGCVPCKAP